MEGIFCFRFYIRYSCGKVGDVSPPRSPYITGAGCSDGSATFSFWTGVKSFSIFRQAQRFGVVSGLVQKKRS